MTNPLDHLDAIQAGPRLGDVTLSDEQNELDVVVSWMRPKRGSAKSIERDRGLQSAAPPSRGRAARGTVVEVDIYRDRAIIMVEFGGSYHLRGALIRIDAAKMELGMWDVIEAGDAVEFDFGPGFRTGRRARFASPEKRLRRR